MNFKRFVPIIFSIFISVFILFLSHFPDYYAFIKTPNGMSFSGQASWFDPWDINVYVAAIKWGQNQGFLLENTYTTLKHTPVLMYPFYTLIGSIFPKISPYLLFHLSAILIGALLIIVLFKLSQTFLKSRFDQLVAVLLISLGGGVGWMFFPSFPSSDLFMTGFTFSSHFQRPHEALGVIFYLLSLVAFYVSTTKKDSRITILSATTLILLVFFYPFYLLSFALIGSIYSLIIYFKNGEKLALTTLGFTLIPAVIVAVPYIKHLQDNTVFGGVLSQNLTSQGLFEIISGYGLLSIVILYQLFKKTSGNGILFLNLWLIISILLSFTPLGFARFYLRTLFFPIVIITLLTFSQFSQKKLLVMVFVILIPLSTFYMTYKRVDEVTKNNHWFYITSNERNALTFLEQNAPKDSGVLAGYTLGNYIPANTKTQVYFGHLIQTPKSEEKINNLTLFYSQKVSTESAREFLDKENIDYVMWGSEEKEISLKYSQKGNLDYPFLKPVFQSGEVSIFSKIK